jgi:hypothetical protein
MSILLYYYGKIFRACSWVKSGPILPAAPSRHLRKEMPEFRPEYAIVLRKCRIRCRTHVKGRSVLSQSSLKFRAVTKSNQKPGIQQRFFPMLVRDPGYSMKYPPPYRPEEGVVRQLPKYRHHKMLCSLMDNPYIIPINNLHKEVNYM